MERARTLTGFGLRRGGLMEKGMALLLFGGIAGLLMLGGAPRARAESAPKMPDSAVPPERLSVDAAVGFALVHHPKLDWFRHRVARKNAHVKVSRSHFYPHVGVGALYGESNPGLGNQSFNNMNFVTPIFPMDYAKMGPVSAPNEPLGVAAVGVNQLLFDFGKFEHRVKERLSGRKASEYWLYSKDAWVILQVKQAYFRVLLDKKLIEVYQKNLDQRKLVMDLTRSLYESDYRSRLDYDLARVDYEKARALLEVEREDLEARISHLNDAMGLGQAGRDDYLLTTALSGSAPGEDRDLASRDQAITRGLTYRPEINAYRTLFRQEREKTKYEQAQHYPLISAFGSYGFMGNMVSGQSYAPGGGWWSGGGSLTIPLYTGGMIRGLTEAAREKARERKYGISDWSHNIRDQVIRARSHVLADRASVRAYAEAVKEADLALELATKRYTANLVSIVDLTLAEVYLLDTEASLATWQYRTQADLAALRFAEGIDYLGFLPEVRKKVVGSRPSGR